MTKEIQTISEIKKELGTFIGNKDNLNALLKTTFNGLGQQQAEQAMLEGMIRGFSITDFMQKDVYAIPFKSGYSLITSISHARKVGMRSGVVGKSKPDFTFHEDGKIDSCTITIKRKVDDYIGDYSATVFFEEYSTGKQLWSSKPKTMIAKVAEMHALRMACPEELSEMYSEEEMEREAIDVTPNVPDEEAIIKAREILITASSVEELKELFYTLTPELRNHEEIMQFKNQLKEKLTKDDNESTD